MSSANIYTFDVTLSGRSLIYNRKRTGVSTPAQIFLEVNS